MLFVVGASSPLPLWERVAPHAVRRRVRGILPLGKLCKDVLQHGSRLLEHVVVPVTGDGKAFSDEGCVTSGIALRVYMLASINLDHKALLETDKVENVILERDLPPELKW